MKKVYNFLTRYYIFSIVVLMLSMVSTTFAQPVVNAGADATICENGTHDLSSATASGNGVLTFAWSTTGQGTFSPSDDILNPVYHPGGTDLNGGTITLTLDVTDDDGNTSDGKSLVIVAYPTVNAGADATICEGGSHYINDADITGSYGAIVWAGGDGAFDNPALIKPTYTPGPGDEANGEVELTLFVAPQHPCIALQSDKLKIDILPGLTVDAGADATICAGESHTLSGSGTAGATYSWTGGAGSWTDAGTLNATYTPDPGEYGNNVTLTLTVSNGTCAPVADDMELTVRALPVVSCMADFDVCIDAGLQTLTGNPIGGTFSGAGVSGDDFDPVSAGAGTHTITYEYTDGDGCTNDCTFDITVNDLPVVTCVADFDVCIDAGLQSLSATPPGGTFSGTGVSGDDFDPVSAGAGTHTITYSYTDGNGCTNTCDFDITVNDLPAVTCMADFDVCIDAGDQTLTGTPTGGTFSGAGVTGDQFDPAAAGSGVHAITYSYTDGNGCTNTCDFDITVNDLPIVTCMSDFDVCIDAGDQTLTGTPTGGTFSGAGVTGDQFDPAAAGSGVHTITYSYTDGNGCTNTCDFDITVNPLPVMNCPALGPYCEDDAPVTLSGATPSGGTYSGTGVAAGDFDPGTAGVGTHTITYEYTDGNGCTNSCTFDITVDPLPTVDAGPDFTVCELETIQFNTNISNECSIFWSSITGIDGSFDDNTIANPVYTPGPLEYDQGSVGFLLAVGACTPCSTGDSDQITVYFQALPEANAGTDATICEDGSYTLAGSVTDNCGTPGFAWTSVDPLGVFDDANSLTANYTPGSTDIAAGFATLTLTANPCTPCLNAQSDDMTLTIDHNPTVQILFDDTLVCEYTNFDFTGLVDYSDAGAVIWAPISGSGTFDNLNAQYPMYQSTTNDAAQGTITLGVLVNAVSPCAVFTQDSCHLTFQLNPRVEAGNDTVVCENGSVTLAGADVKFSNDVLWTDQWGDGTFDDATLVNASYSPGSSAITAGLDYLYLTAQPINPCGTAVYDSLKVTIQPLPVANAGIDATICEDDTYTVSGTASNNCLTTLWETSGDGTFDNPAALSATYTPSALDIMAGSVTLSFTAYSCTPCVDDSTDTMELTFQLLPEVDAGTDADVCESGSALLEATASNYSSVLWTSAGDGTFTGGGTTSTILNPTYYPGTSDASGGTVILTVVVNAVSPCTTPDTDQITLSVTPLPVADAGLDATACETGYTFSIGDVSASNYSNIEWTTNGDGSFSKVDTLGTTYYPGSGDVNIGIVTLTLVANPIHPCVLSFQDDMDLLIYESPKANAGADATICDNGNHQLVGATATNYSSLLWTSSTGNGTFVNNTDLNPLYTPGAADYGTSIDLCLEALPKSPCAVSDTDCMSLFIQALPTANAGNDGTLCESGGSVSGNATDATSTLWSVVVGNGTFDDATAATTTYFPAAADVNTTVTLRFTAEPILPCLANASDDVDYYIQPSATVSAGNDKHICENQKLGLVGATAANYSSVLWTSASDGTFTDPSVLTAIYNPSATDIANGSVVLTIQANDESPCTSFVTDDMTLTFELLPIANAGPDATLCEDVIFMPGADSTNAASLLWSTSGDGTFDNEFAQFPQYFPGTADKALGTVTLTLTATPIGPCNLSDGDDVVIDIILNPVVSAGSDADVCEDALTYTLAGASAANYASILWTSTGDGGFDDATTVNPVYTFGATDPGTTVTLCLTAQPLTPCVAVVDSCIDLYIQKLPTAFAGIDKTTCGVDALLLADAWVHDASSILWTSAGDGTFDNPTLQNPTYTPGSNDSTSQSVVLTVAANAVSPCNPAIVINDNVTITIQWPPLANAGADAVICENQTHTLSGVLTNSISGYWTTSGDGGFDDNTSLTATYTPGATDILNGTADLCLIAEPILPCTVNSAPDCMTLTIQHLSTANAGLDGVVCETGTYTVGSGDASVTNASGPQWSTIGDGTLTDATTLTPSYTPGTADIGNGFVDLCLVGLPTAPCLVSGPSDCMTLTINMNPIANAGPDATTCDGVDYQIVGASAQFGSAISWASSGDGTFVNSTDENPLYQLGPSDIGNTSVTLTMTVNAAAPCVGIDDDIMTLVINPQPAVIFAENGNPFYGGANLEYCFDENIEVTLHQIVSGLGPFDFAWTIDDGVNPPVPGNASGVALGGVLFSSTYAPGSYTVNLTSMVDGHGCSPADLSPYEITFTVTTEPLISFGFNGVEANSGDTFTYCGGTNLVVDFMNVYGGTAPFTGGYSVTGTSSWNDTFTNVSPGYEFHNGIIAPGTYNIVMTSLVDADGCAASPATLAYMHGTVIIKPEPAVLFAFNGVDVATGDVLDYCYDEPIVSTLSTVLEGVAPFTITVEENGTPTTYTNVNAGFEFFNGTKAPGTYTIVVTSIVDADGCAVTNPGSIYNLTVNVNPEPELVFSFNGVIAAAGDVFNYCETDDITVILDNAPAGTGPFAIIWELDGLAQAPVNVGVGGTAFYIPAALVFPGSYSIVAKVIVDANGCLVTDPETKYYATVNIQAAPIANAGPDATTCDGVDYQIAGASAQFGSAISWTSSGDGTFDDPTAENPIYELGSSDAANTTVTLTMTVNAISPCSGIDDDVMTLHINPLPAVIFAENGNPFFGGANLEYCFDENIEITLHQILSGTAPFDFAWTIDDGINPPVAGSATGVTLGGVLFSNTYAPGSYTVKLTSMVDANGCSPDLTPYEINFTVNPQPDPQFTIDGDQVLPGQQYNYCWDVSSIILEIVSDFGGTPTVGDAPFDVSFTATGLPSEVVLTGVNFGDNIDILSYYSPTPGPGTYTIQVTKFEDANGCAIPTSVLNNWYHFDIVIDTEPTAVITLDGSTPLAVNEYCYDDSFEICIAGAGGTGDWTATWAATGPSGPFGDVMTGTSECWNFNAIDFIPGTYDLTLVSLEDANGCFASPATLNSYAFQIQINPAPVVSCMADFAVCIDAGLQALTASPTGGTFSGIGVSGTDFDPSIAGAGVTTVTYSYTDANGCTSTCSFDITVNDLPVVTCMADFAVCIDAGLQALTATPTGGTFSGTGVSGDQFDPSIAGAGVTTVTYDYTDANGCSSSCSFDITVNDLPVVTCMADFAVCIDAGLQALTASPTGGTFSGTGVSGSDFDPSIAGAGVTTVTYSYTDGNGCTNTCSFDITVNDLPVVTCMADFAVCIDAGLQALTASPTGGTFSGTGVSGSDFDPAVAGVGVTTVTYDYTDGNGCSSSCSFDITVSPIPTAYAGADATICAGETYTIADALITNANLIQWSTSGNGVFDDNTIQNPTYTPGFIDNISGNVVLSVLVSPISPCTVSADDNMTLYIQLPPGANAGADATICEGDTYTLAGATAINYSGLLWTGGLGSFDDSTALNPTYTPDVSEYGTAVSLCIEAIANTPCTISATDCMDLFIQKNPTVDAGVDATICEGSDYTLGATATDASSALWSGGAGSFDDATSLTAVYTPDAGEYGTTVSLCVEVQPTSPCVATASDCMDLFIQGNPTADAGADATICAGETYTLSDAIAGNAGNIFWTTIGNGSFDFDNIQNPTYTPGSVDLIVGSVELCILVAPTSPCTTGAQDCMTLTIQAVPVADAGSNTTVCEGEVFNLGAASASNYSMLTWSSDGQGSFDYPNSLNPTYTPAGTDIGSTVTLCLAATPIAPCAGAPAISCVSLTVQGVASASAGDDASVCEDGTFELDQATATNYASISWSSNGSGSFDDATAMNPTYTPDASEYGTTVTLCMTVQAISPCVAAAIDCLDLYVQELPTADAGVDATILTGETYTLQGAATNYSSLEWTTSGTGTFDDENIEQPVYTPSNGDKIAGEVLLTLTAYAVGPCTVNAVHNMLLTIEGTPPVVVITAPISNSYFTTVPITVEGTASDVDNDLDYVEVRVNGGAWQMATGADNWTVDVYLAPCMNTIEARATDMSGLESVIVAVTNIELEGQYMPMYPGWSMISSYIQPADADLYVVDDYITPANNLNMMISANPNGTFRPSGNLNSIGDWDAQRGYKIKGYNAGTWLMPGTKTANQTVNLTTQFMYLPVLTNQAVALEDYINPNDVLIIFELLPTNGVYWPGGGLKLIDSLRPGFAYGCTMLANASITYPAYVDCNAKSSMPTFPAVAANNSPWHLERTSNMHFISISGKAVAELDNAEFIGAFDANGNCIGYADVSEKADNYLLTIYGDELSTEAKDGVTVGEYINLVSYNGIENDVVARYDLTMPDYNGTFAERGMSKIVGFTETTTGIGGLTDVSAQVRVFPNPASDMVNIYYPIKDAASVAVTLTNASGSVVMQQELTSEDSQINISKLQPGVYFVKFENNGSVVVKRLIIK